MLKQKYDKDSDSEDNNKEDLDLNPKIKNQLKDIDSKIEILGKCAIPNTKNHTIC